MKIKFGLHENIIVSSVLTIILITLKFFKIIDYDALWIFSPLWILVIGVIVVYIVTSLMRLKPSIGKEGKYFNYCEFPSHPGIISERKSNWCSKKNCNYHKIYREDA